MLLPQESDPAKHVGSQALIYVTCIAKFISRAE